MNGSGWTMGGHRIANEDAFALTNVSAVVADGSTALDPVAPRDGLTPAAWLSTRASRALADTFAAHDSLAQALDIARARLASEYGAVSLAAVPQNRSRSALDPDSAGQGPTAAIIGARLRGDVLDFVSLGDCTAVIRRSDGAVSVWHDSSVSAVDDDVVAHMRSLAVLEGISPREARPLVYDLLVAHRLRCNTPGGYWVFDLSGAGIPHARTYSLPAQDVRDFALMSDGFWMGDSIGAWASRDDLLDSLAGGGSNRMGRTNESILDSDPELERFPRLKPIDDMTVVYVAM